MKQQLIEDSACSQLLSNQSFPTVLTPAFFAQHINVSVISDCSNVQVWVHPDNVMEVKTFILRRLPLLVYDSEPRQKPSVHHNPDPTVTNLYFDDSSFSSYMNKLERATSATSLRLRWYGKLNEQSEIAFEKKVTNFVENAEDVESRFMIKKKYVKSFLDGKYFMEKNIKKMRDGAKNDAEIRSYQEPIKEIQNMIQEKELSPGNIPSKLN